MKLSRQERSAIQDTLAHYAWAMDTGDIEGVVVTFTVDACVKDTTGKIWGPPDGPRQFATHFLTPNRGARQHWLQHMMLEEIGEGEWKLTSYWLRVASDSGNAPALQLQGRYSDTFAKLNGQWLMKQKLIDLWDSKPIG